MDQNNLYNIIPKNLKILTAEEEKEVISYYHKTNDPVIKKKLKDHLILNNMAWIIEIIRTEATRAGLNGNSSFLTQGDLIGVAVEGINKAIDKYQDQGHKLSTLAKFYVGYSVAKHIKENLVPWIKRPGHIIISSTKFKNIIENHKKIFGKEPAFDELKLQMPSLTKKQYVSLKSMDAINSSISLSNLVKGSDKEGDLKTEFGELIEDKNNFDINLQIDKEVKYQRILEALVRIKGQIKPRDFDMFLMRYGIAPYTKPGEVVTWCCEKCKEDNAKRIRIKKIRNGILKKKGKRLLPEYDYEIKPYSVEHTLQTIGDKYGLTRERVRQITDDILKKIKIKIENDKIKRGDISKEAKAIVKEELEFTN